MLVFEDDFDDELLTNGKTNTTSKDYPDYDNPLHNVLTFQIRVSCTTNTKCSGYKNESDTATDTSTSKTNYHYYKAYDSEYPVGNTTIFTCLFLCFLSLYLHLSRFVKLR